jgi:hypothetical protein
LRTYNFFEKQAIKYNLDFARLKGIKSLRWALDLAVFGCPIEIK